jgi:hypothetical protein
MGQDDRAEPHSSLEFDVRLEWGHQGLEAMGAAGVRMLIIAAELDVSDAVPMLVDGCYRNTNGRAADAARTTLERPGKR